MGLVDPDLLDLDATYLGLSDDTIRRIECYQAYLKQGASDKEIELLRRAWAGNQLTGNDCFIDEIESRTRGRPCKEG